MSSNGRLPSNDLARIYQPDVEVYLRKDAAAAWNTMRIVCKRYLKTEIYPGGPDSAYRTYERQQYWREYWCSRGACGNAAVPGTSNHGWGLAVDLPSITMRTQAIDLVGKRFGWAKEWSDAQHEWWHLAWREGVWNGPDPGTDYRNPVARRGSGVPRGQRWYVRKLQRRLKRHGYEVYVSGKFGPRTEAAVKAFQKDHGLKADGVVGAGTWKKLRSKPRRKPVPAPDKPSKPAQPKHPSEGGSKPEKPSEPPEKEHPTPEKPVEKSPIPAELIDVSNNNGAINWKEVRGRGIRGVYLKLTEGQDWIDPLATEARIAAIKENRIEYGWYHFLRPKKRDAALEARFFIKQARERGGWGHLLPVVDIEVTDLGPEETANYLARFIGVLRRESTCKQVLVYASPGWWSSHVPETRQLAAQLPYCKAWVAHWGVQEATPLRGIIGVSLHQYSDKGTVPGIKGGVDMNKTKNLRAIQIRELKENWG